MNKLKYGIILTTILFAQSVFAESRTIDVVNVTGYVTKTNEYNIQSKVVNTPIRTCNIVNVPIYGSNGKAQTGEVLGGAIIGGILGNQVGGGKGKDAATILGAILGADFANKKGGQQKIVGYKQVEQCEVTYEKTYETQTACDVWVDIPAIEGVTHMYTTDTCPARNSKVGLVAEVRVQLR